MARQRSSPDHWTYSQRYVRCTAPCATCDGGGKHGPYWYRSRKVHGRVVTQYLGKNRPAEVDDEVHD